MRASEGVVSRPFGSLPDRFEPDGDPVGVGYLLPGGSYSPSAPLLEFARQALLQHSYVAQQVWWDAPGDTREHDHFDWDAWVAGRLVEAVDAERSAPGRVVVVAKSLGTCAAPYVSDRGWPAIWFTPLLREPAIAAAIRDNPAPQLVVTGGADHLNDPAVAATLASDVVEIEDADHTLWVRGDAVRSAAIQLEVAQATEAFLQRLGES